MENIRHILTGGRVNAWRKDREFLLDTRQGKYEYDDLVEKADALKNQLPQLYQVCLKSRIKIQ